jgi:hypothetical protein
VLHGSIAHPNHATAIAINAEHAHFLTAHTQGSDRQNERDNLVCHLREQNTAAVQYVSQWKEIFAFQKQPFQLAANTQD